MKSWRFSTKGISIELLKPENDEYWFDIRSGRMGGNFSIPKDELKKLEVFIKTILEDKK